MNDALAVHVVDGLEDLLDQVRRVLFRVASLFHDPVEEFAAIDPAFIGGVAMIGSCVSLRPASLALAARARQVMVSRAEGSFGSFGSVVRSPRQMGASHASP